MIVYKLLSRNRGAYVHPDPVWRKEAAKTLFCAECFHLRRSVYPSPVQVKLDSLPKRMTLGEVYGASIGIIHARLLGRLQAQMAEFVFADVYSPEDRRMDQYKSFYSRRYIQPRGTSKSRVKQCDECGTIHYIWQGNPYVLKHEIGNGHVYQDEGCNTYVDERLASQVDWTEFRDFELYPFPIRDHPEDGWRLPGDPDWSAMGIPCKEWQSKVLNIPSLQNEDMGPWPAEGQSVDAAAGKLVLPALPAEQVMTFRYFEGPLTDMAGLAGEGKTCSLCGRQGTCFDLEQVFCEELADTSREGKVGCFECLRTGRFEFVHDTEVGLLDDEGLRSERTGKLYLPKGFKKEALVELRRTPPLAAHQEERWLTHCHDFMVYQGVWDPSDFYENAADGDGRALFMEMTDPDDQHLWDDSWDDKSEPLTSWYGTYYVFQCRHCGKRRGYWDVD